MSKKHHGARAQATAAVVEAPKEADPKAVERRDDAPEEAAPEGPATGEAQAAYEARRPVWAKLGGAELDVPRANLAFVTWRVIQIGDALQRAEVHVAFEGLGAVLLPGGGRFDAGCVRALPVIGRALWHARTRQLSAAAQATTVSLPTALVDEATALRGRMLKVVEYQCVDEANPDDPVAADLASIRSVQGPRYLDLATDLSRLAAYYHSPEWRPVLREDKRRYREGDGKAADDLAASILTQLQQRDDSAAVWAVEVNRGWADLQRTWEAVRRGAAFVFGDDVDAHVPALGTLRPAPGRKGAANDDEPAKPAEPVAPVKPA
ncbi:MAG: hypothetical protein U0324_02675 [Polyangiales bacterium]